MSCLMLFNYRSTNPHEIIQIQSNFQEVHLEK